MSTLALVQKEHAEILTKMHLLEKALIGLLQKHETEYIEKTYLQKDFLESFRRTLTFHFIIEEEALFPFMRKISQNAELLVKELLFQHQSMIEECDKLMQTADIYGQKNKLLLKLVQELATHAEKEEREIPPIVKQMSLEQIREVDEVTKRLGYQI